MLLEFAGAFRKDPKRRRQREGEPVQNDPLPQVPPARLSKALQALWLELYSDLVPGVALRSDAAAWEELVRLTLASRRNKLTTQSRAQLYRLLESFGMTPSSRSRVSTGRGGKPESRWAKFAPGGTNGTG